MSIHIQSVLKSMSTVRAFQFFHVLRFGSSILIGVFMVNWGIDMGDFSRYEYFLFISSLLSFFWTNGILKSMMSLYKSYDDKQQQELLTNVLILLLGFSVVMGSLFLGIRYIVPSLVDIDHPFLILMFFVFSVIGAMGELILILRDDAKSLLSYGVIIYTIQLSLLVSIVIYSGQLEHILIGLVIWAFLRLAYSLKLLTSFSIKKINWSKVKLLLWYAFPLIGESLMGDAMKYVDGGLVKHFFDDDYFALYRTGARELPFSILIIGAIGTAMLPHLTEGLVDGLHRLKQELSKAMKWLYPLSMILMLSSPILFPFIYKDSFILSASIFNIYLLLIVSRVLMPHVVLLSQKSTYILLWIAIIELILNLGLSLILLSWIGILGIPIASLISFFIVKILMVAYLKKYHNINLSSYLDVKLYIGYSAALIATYFIANIYLL